MCVASRPPKKSETSACGTDRHLFAIYKYNKASIVYLNFNFNFNVQINIIITFTILINSRIKHFPLKYPYHKNVTMCIGIYNIIKLVLNDQSFKIHSTHQLRILKTRTEINENRYVPCQNEKFTQIALHTRLTDCASNYQNEAI